MSLIVVPQAQDGVTGVNAASINTPVNTIANDYNGGITDANIATGAAIAGSKINMATAVIPYIFNVYRTSALNSTNAYAAVAFDTKLFDRGSNVDVVTNKGRFTAPVTGYYEFSASVGNSSATNTFMGIALYVNGVQRVVGNTADPSQALSSGTKLQVSTGQISMSATDYAEVYFIGGSGSALEVGQTACWFSGKLSSA